MAAKKTNYTATEAFMWADVAYKVGDTFRIPEGWTTNDDQNNLLAVRKGHRPNRVGSTAFNYKRTHPFQVKEIVGNRSVTKQHETEHTVILPVE